MTAAAPAPLERELELDALDGFIEAAAAGAGRLLVIEGPAGIGKTLLIRELRRRAQMRGLRVLTARGGELERDFSFGMLRQLLEPAIADGHPHRDLFGGAARLAEPVFAAAPEASAGDAPHAVLHGLYWLVVNLAQPTPVVLAVDDVQWSDRPSLRFLIHLARRLEGLPVGLVVTSRTGDPATQDELQRALRAEAEPPILHPQAFSQGATAELITNGLGGDAAPALCAACHEASGGNPFLLTELLGELRAARAHGRQLDPDRIRTLGPERVASALLMRVGQVDRDAPALARAVAVLGAQAELDHAAEVGGIEPARARELVAALRDAMVLERDEPLRFVHPIVRSAIYEDIPTSMRSALHRRAGEVLAAQRAEPESVAVHLLATDVADERTAVPTLRAAARAAAARGAPETASSYLRRALREPLTDADRAGVLLELGATERALGLSDAQTHLREAVELATDPRSRAEAANALGWAVGPVPDAQRELIPLFERTADAVREDDRELALRLEARRLEALSLSPGNSPRFEDEVARFSDLPGETQAECMLLSFCARTALLEGGSASDVAELAGRAAAHLDLTEPGAHSIWLASTIFWLPTDRGLQLGFERRLDNAIALAARRGLANAFAWASNMRAVVRNVAGDLLGAEADARAALDSGGLAGPFPHVPVTPLVESLAEQGKTAEAEAVLRDRGLAGEIPRIRPFTVLLIARARMHAVAGDLAAAWVDLDEALRRLEQAGSRGVAGLDARLEAALVRRALGDAEGARRLSDHALQLARAWGVERAVGGAMRVAGLLRGGADGLPLLQEAVDLLARSPARLWHAQALVDLGSALRRAGRRSAARDALAEGMDIAHRCGATPLVERAHQELTLAGARPRRIAQTGADALTPSERRVADLAAGGMTNKEIAQALFVTLRTVEMHLSTAYRKLAIDSRTRLSQALGAER